MVSSISSLSSLSFSGLSGSRFPVRVTGARVEEAVTQGPTAAELRDLASGLAKLRVALERLQEQAEIQSGSSGPKSVLSSSVIGLVDATFTTLSSTEEVNATPTSFSPFGPTLIGSSTSDATVTGNKQGNPNDVLTFEVSDAGTVGGSVDLKLKVFDQDDNQIDEVFLAAGTPPDTVVSLSNGLDVSFSAGELALGDEFDVTFAPGGAPTATPWLIPDPTVGGTYTGSVDDVLTFEVSNGGYVGGSLELKLKVLDGQQNQIDEVVFAAGTPADTPFTLSNGLEISLSSGKLVQERTFQVNVYSSVPSAVDPNKPFDGTRNNNPNFESGTTVTAGSFDVNGATINVGASDTLNDVLAQINASSAGVSATFDVATETVLFTQDTTGSANQIVFSGDTSGFLAATKLSGASQVLGQDAEPSEPIDQVGAFSGISSGTFQINGVSIAIDITTDSLNDVVANINSSAAGVTASYSVADDVVTISASSSASSLSLDDGGTGFFAALNITPGVFQFSPTAVEGFLDQAAVRGRLRDVGEEIDEVFDRALRGLDDDVATAVRDHLQASIGDAFTDLVSDTGASLLLSGLGVDFSFKSPTEGIFDFSGSQFDRASGDQFEKVYDFLFKESTSLAKGGLVSALLEGLDELQSVLAEQLGTPDSAGLILDLVV